MKTQDYKCPICQNMTTMRSGYFKKRPKIGGWVKQYYGVKIKCDKCGYRYKSSDGLSQENFIYLTLYLEWCTADDPGLSDITKSIERHVTLRRKLLKEVKLLWSIRDSRLIIECMISPNAQKDALKQKLAQYIVQNRTIFPILSYYASGESDNEGQEDQGRSKGKRNSHRDGDEQNGSGSGK